MKIADVPQRGKRGRIVASRNRFGQFHREQVSLKQPCTPAQQAAWGNMKDLSQMWNELTEPQWNAWRTRAQGVHSRPRLGQSGPLDGCQLFKKINRVLATCGREPQLDPPPSPIFGPNPVIGFTISKGKDGLAFKLKLSPGVRGTASPATGDLMLFGSVPCSAGVGKNDHYAFLGLLLATVGEEIDITELYLKKLAEWRRLMHKLYHLPLAGSRVFIRVCQQVDGWKDELGMFRASALVPRNRPGVRRPKKREN
jgi:hypothetical protein